MPHLPVFFLVLSTAVCDALARDADLEGSTTLPAVVAGIRGEGPGKIATERCPCGCYLI